MPTIIDSISGKTSPNVLSTPKQVHGTRYMITKCVTQSCRFKLLFGTYSYISNMGNWLLDLVPVFVRDLLFSRLFGEYGQNIYIDYRCYFRYYGRIKLGSNVTINRGCRFFASHKVPGVEIRLGNGVVISPEVSFYAAGHDHDYLDLPDIAKSIVVNDYAWIGGRSIVLPGVIIGEGAVIGAGSVVTRDIPPWTVAVGNPAKVVKQRTRGESLPL